jgi:hypothetical protein
MKPPNPLSPNSTFLDRVEYALQWIIGLAIVDLKGKPCLSGMLTCLLLYTPMIAGLVFIMWLTGYLKW